MGLSKNKKIIFATLISCGLVFSAIIWIGSRIPKNITATLSAENERTQANLKDSDEDGLLDWEESLWKTDIDNPDTDGDGTPDGQEIALGQDPAKAGNAALFTTPQASSTEEDLSSTDVFSRQLLSRLLKAKASGQDLSPESVAFITNEFLGTQFQYESYSVGDLTIKDDSSEASVKEYVNSLGVLLKAPTDYRNAEQVIFDFAQKADFSILEELAVVSGSHVEMYHSLLAMPVPKGLVSVHLSLINSISATAEDLDTLSEVAEGDAMILAVGLSQYQNNSKTTTETLAELRGIIQTLGITFNMGEPGNVLMS